MEFRYPGYLILLLSLALLFACAQAPEEQNPPQAAAIQVEQALSEPAQYGPYDAGWQVEMDFSTFQAPEESLFLRGLDGENFRFRLGAHEDQDRDVWRGWIYGLEDENRRRGSFTFTRQRERIAGRINLDGHSYSLSGNTGDYRLMRVDPDKVPPPGPPVVKEPDNG